jgi:adenylate cyclase
MPGPEVQANAISTVLRGLPLRDAPRWLEVLAVLALAFVVPLASLRLPARWSIAIGAAALALWLVAAQLAFDRGTVLTVVPPVLALLVGAVGALGAAAVLAARERRRMRFLFGRFVPEPVVDELLSREDTTGGIAGVRQESTVLFCDLRGFTTFAENAGPELVIEVLNTYLSEMSDAILGHNGTVVSYLGDGIMAVFGSPVESERHAIDGLAAAEELLAVRLPRLNAWLAERDLPPFRLGVGLNSGAVMSGTVGSDQRMEYAAVGDTTNVAARLQAATKGTPHALFASQTTWEALDAHSRARLAAAGEKPVAGRGQPVPVYAPRAERRLRVA